MNLLSQEDVSRITQLRDRLWVDYLDQDTCRLRTNERLTMEEWEWLRSLVRSEALVAEVASGLMTPNPFVLLLDCPDEPEILMVHPTQIPDELRGEDPKELFRRASRP